MGHRTAFQPPAHTWVNEGIIKLLKDAEVVVTTYNYIFNDFMRSLLLRRMNTSLDKVLLIVDEAHNITKFSLHPERQTIPIDFFKKAGEEAKIIDEELAFSLINLYEALKEIRNDEEVLPKEMFQTIDYSKCLYYGEQIQEEKLVRGEIPISYLLEIVDFLELVNKKDTIISVSEGQLEAMRLKIVEILPKTYASVSMSATIRPFKAYIKLCGLPEDKTIGLTIPYPFPKENLKVLLTTDVSTKLKERNENLYYKIYKLLNAVKWTNANELNAEQSFGVAAFFASHELLQNFLDFLNNYNFKLNWDDVFIEKKFMETNEIHQLFINFIDTASRKNALLLAVQGGRLAEGVDYIANTLQTIIIIGVPYAKPTQKMKSIIDFYDKIFGKGKLYGYVIPAIWSSLQAAGRGIRGPNDVCTIIFMDRRFAKLKGLIPMWISENIQKISSSSFEDAVSIL